MMSSRRLAARAGTKVIRLMATPAARVFQNVMGSSSIMPPSGGVCTHAAVDDSAQVGQSRADDEIDGADGQVDLQGLESRAGHDLPGTGQLDEADDRRQRRVLHDLHRESDGRWYGGTDRLRDDDEAHRLRPAQGQ